MQPTAHYTADELRRNAKYHARPPGELPFHSPPASSSSSSSSVSSSTASKLECNVLFFFCRRLRQCGRRQLACLLVTMTPEWLTSRQMCQRVPAPLRARTVARWQWAKRELSPRLPNAKEARVLPSPPQIMTVLVCGRSPLVVGVFRYQNAAPIPKAVRVSELKALVQTKASPIW